MAQHNPPVPAHVAGNSKGEEYAKKHGREPGRAVKDKKGYRSSRDSTSINAAAAGPVDPRMPEMPPA